MLSSHTLSILSVHQHHNPKNTTVAISTPLTHARSFISFIHLAPFPHIPSCITRVAITQSSSGWFGRSCTADCVYIPQILSILMQLFTGHKASLVSSSTGSRATAPLFIYPSIIIENKQVKLELVFDITFQGRHCLNTS